MKIGQTLNVVASGVGVGKSIFRSERMNDRIKELAEQAEKYADDNFKGEPEYSEAYDSKFAELIVQDCIAVLIKNDYHGEWLGEKLKQHFGVK